MKKSQAVPGLLVGSVAAAVLSGCGPSVTQTRHCTDGRGRVLPDGECERGTYGGGSRAYPHWIYGGSYRDGRVTGGSLAPADGARVVTSTGRVISRGGFGSTGGGRGFFSGG